MTFPLINISIEKWPNSEDIIEFIVYEKYIYTNNDSVFNEFYKDKLFCDCEGSVFKATRKVKMTQHWRNWLKFLPNVWKTEVIYEATTKTMSIEELREYLMNRISDLDDSDFIQKWLLKVKMAKTYSQLINGE
ncbi:hypothetical protein J2X31_003345 [Flavobacterium arsenatis]|uniref:Uncharacterized protein n=1 Tax=Flavobacterium arsenatis TaxID=1484332 RepID=A0ABU1TTW0_9FLAO|nr:hypothetical protein [Flavobacterium arsenatis]MDR6969315.1 hypothetical protein [Flavobacterium arsenatis]